MNKKKRIAILFAVIIILAVGIIIAVASHQKKEMDFDEFADRFEKSAEEVLGEDVKKVSKTELAATLTYGDQNDKDNNIYYRILKTTFYEGDPAEIHGLHTEAGQPFFLCLHGAQSVLLPPLTSHPFKKKKPPVGDFLKII